MPKNGVKALPQVITKSRLRSVDQVFRQWCPQEENPSRHLAFLALHLWWLFNPPAGPQSFLSFLCCGWNVKRNLPSSLLQKASTQTIFPFNNFITAHEREIGRITKPTLSRRVVYGFYRCSPWSTFNSFIHLSIHSFIHSTSFYWGSVVYQGVT